MQSPIAFILITGLTDEDGHLSEMRSLVHKQCISPLIKYTAGLHKLVSNIYAHTRIGHVWEHANRCGSLHNATAAAATRWTSYQINESVQRRRHTTHAHAGQSNTFVNFAFIQIELITQPGGNNRESVSNAPPLAFTTECRVCVTSGRKSRAPHSTHTHTHTWPYRLIFIP